MRKVSKAPVKPPHPSRLNPLDLALLNAANGQLETARFKLQAKILESRVRELEYNEAMRTVRDDAQALQGALSRAETDYRELAARLSKDYAVDLKTSAIQPETGEITTLAEV